MHLVQEESCAGVHTVSSFSGVQPPVGDLHGFGRASPLSSPSAAKTPEETKVPAGAEQKVKRLGRWKWVLCQAVAKGKDRTPSEEKIGGVQLADLEQSGAPPA